MNQHQISRKWLLIGLFLLLALFSITTTQSALAQTKVANGVVATGQLNVRSGPGVEYPVVTSVFSNAPLAIYGKSGFNTWVQVGTANGITGWVNSTYIVMDVPLSNLPVVGGTTATPPAGATATPPAGTTATPPATRQIPAVGVVNTGAVNVRSGPGYNFPIITIAYQGYTVTLLGRTADNAWAKVQMVDGTQGWINFGALDTTVPASSLPITDAPITPPAGTAVGVVNTGQLNLRSGPGTEYSVVASVFNGHVVQLLGRNTFSTWLKVRLFDGQEGWSNAKYITTNYPIGNLPVMWDDAVIPGAPTAIVTTGNLNIRTGPGASYAAVTSVPYGTTLTLLGRNADGTWVKVRTNSGQEGWVNANYLTTSVPVSSLPIVDGSTGTGVATAVVNTGALNVRSGPGVSYSSVTVVYQGTQLTLIGRNADGSWVKVRTPNGTEGWVNADLIQANIPISNLPVVDGSTTGTPTQPIAYNAVVTTGALNVRSGPSIDYPSVTVVSQGTEMNLIGRSATTGWVQVVLPGGQQGWVNPNFIYTTININTLPVTG
ncbi:MAG: SH3 domain-containing protein [Anaerolineae bacterium]|nr:SH3 domain-containing protein [Anaerolineae bacterium]